MIQENTKSNARLFSSKTLLVYLTFIIPPLLWAGNFIVGRAVRNDISPITLTLARWSVALLVILPFAFPYIRRDFKQYLQHTVRIIAISLSGVAAFSLLVYYGLHHTSGTNALLLNSCVPVLIMLFSSIFFRTKLNLYQIAGMLISCIGVLTIILNGQFRSLLKLEFSSGDLMLLTAMACFAFYTLWLRNIPQSINRLGLLGVQIIITLIAVLALELFMPQDNEIVTTWNAFTISAVLFLGVFPSFLSYLLYGRCVEMIGAARAGLSIHLIPVFGVVLSVIFLGEHIKTYHLLGIFVILTGVSFANLKKTGQKP